MPEWQLQYCILWLYLSSGQQNRANDNEKTGGFINMKCSIVYIIIPWEATGLLFCYCRTRLVSAKLVQNVTRTVMVSKRCISLNLVIPWLFLWHHCEIDFNEVEQNASTTAAWIVIKFCTDIYVPFRMNSALVLQN